MPDTSLLESKLLRLRDTFIDGLPQRFDALSNAIASCERDEVTRQFHSLAGTAGMHGIVAVAELASEGEEACGAFEQETIEYLKSIVDSLRAAMPQPARAIGRILCVDDDADQAETISVILRDDPAHATVPIIFLTKPVEPELLLSIVPAQLKSSRAMQQLIDRDGLTGVLTHVAFMRRAQTEMTRARRAGEELALVMLDGCRDLQQWKQRAEDALCSAKHHGRARVEAA